MSTKINPEEQLDFFFWLGADGEMVNVSKEEFAAKQDQWDGLRPNEDRGD